MSRLERDVRIQPSTCLVSLHWVSQHRRPRKVSDAKVARGLLGLIVGQWGECDHPL